MIDACQKAVDEGDDDCVADAAIDLAAPLPDWISRSRTTNLRLHTGRLLGP